jgi:NMT1-like family
MDQTNADLTERKKTRGVSQAMSTLTDTFGLTRWAATGVVLFTGVVVLLAVFWFIHSAPPRTLIITAGPPGSSFVTNAEKYAIILARNHVTLKILPSEGSEENLERLGDPKFDVDIGFVQGGETNKDGKEKLYSLGSVAYQPLLIFHRGATPATLLSDFAGKRLAIGQPGSGVRALALLLLATNGIVPGGSTTFMDLGGEEAANALQAGQVDAVFLMGDSASGATMRTLLRAPGIQMFDFVQADAYTRRFPFLNKLDLPRGAIDFARDLPPHDVNLIGPTVQLVARAKLHPALSDLLLEAAKETNSEPTLLQKRDEFPAPLKQGFAISPDAQRFYKSGKRFLYQELPFWLASLVNRVLVAFVPMLLVLIPGIKVIPKAYKWRIQLKIYRWYRSLLRLERESAGEMTAEKRGELQKRLENIEKSVNQMRVPASFAGQFYGLREHIGLVREKMG